MNSMVQPQSLLLRTKLFQRHLYFPWQLWVTVHNERMIFFYNKILTENNKEQKCSSDKSPIIIANDNNSLNVSSSLTYLTLSILKIMLASSK